MDTSRAILIWAWDDAPAELREIASLGGDEEFVVFAPNGVDGRLLRDVLTQRFSDTNELAHDDGTLLVWAH